MKKLLIASLFWLVPSLAFGACTGIFPANTVCGTGASSGPPVPIGTPHFSSAVVGKLNNICYVDGSVYTNIQAAIADTTCSTIIIPSNQTISTALTMSRQVHLKCENGATISYTGNLGQLIFTSDGSSLEDCTLVGPGTGSAAGDTPVKPNATNFKLLRNTIHDFYSTFVRGMVSNTIGTDISGFYAVGNNIYNNKEFAFLMNPNAGETSNIRIIGNKIDNGFYLNTDNTHGTLRNIVINDNIMSFGGGGLPPTVGVSASCIESIGVNQSIFNFVASGNTCTYTTDQTEHGSECYGFGGLVGYAITGNVCDGNGHIVQSNFIEINVGTNGTVTGNTGRNMTVADGYGIQCGSCTKISITGNTIDKTFCGTCSGIIVTEAVDATITGNMVVMPAGSVGAGIIAKCSTGPCSRITVAGNTIESDQTVNSVGVWMERVGGTFGSVQIGPNQLSSPDIGVKIDASITNVCLIAGLNNANTKIANSGSASVCN